MSPTRNNEILNFVCIHPDDSSEVARDTYNEPGDPQNLLMAYDGFDSRALALLKMADPATLKVWKLVDMDPVPKWRQGKFCLLGDAAHPLFATSRAGQRSSNRRRCIFGSCPAARYNACRSSGKVKIV